MSSCIAYKYCFGHFDTFKDIKCFDCIALLSCMKIAKIKIKMEKKG